MDDQQMIQELKRYAWKPDDLLKIEIENLYFSSSEERRIEITKLFNTKNELHMPDEWVRLTLQKGGENELIALAKYAKYPNVTKISDDKNLDDVLSGKDTLIKCALYENENFLYGGVFGRKGQHKGQNKLFAEASFVERLALIRNSNINLEIIKSIFNPTDDSFNLTDDQRIALIAGFSQNKVHNKTVEQPSDDYNELWDLSLKVLDYPNKGLVEFITYSIFYYCPCADNKMLEIYQKLKGFSGNDKSKAELYESARKNILKMIESLPVERKKKKTLISLLKEALNDPNEDIRSTAEFLLPDDEIEDKDFHFFKNIFKGAGKTLGIIWFFIQILIKFIVVYAIYSSLDSKFETIVVSLVLIIYFQITFMGIGWGILGTEGLKEGIKLFNHIRTLLRDTISDEEKQAQKLLIEKVKLGWKFYVGYAFDFIFYIIAIFNLLRATLFS